MEVWLITNVIRYHSNGWHKSSVVTERQIFLPSVVVYLVQCCHEYDVVSTWLQTYLRWDFFGVGPIVSERHMTFILKKSFENRSQYNHAVVKGTRVPQEYKSALHWLTMLSFSVACRDTKLRTHLYPWGILFLPHSP